jgi:3-oxoacyl-[acyl-carrier protein] reductase
MTGVAGRRYLVTGASSGIGLGVAERLVASGARVALMGRTPAKVQAAAASLGEAALPLPADVADEEAVAGAFDEAVAWAGGLDGAVLGAGVQLHGEDASIDQLDLAVWDRTIAANLRGMAVTGKYAARALIAGGGGAIVVVGSPTGIVGQARGYSSYSASKGGCHALARVMAADLAPHGIRVNIVVPGFTDTPLVEAMTSDSETLEHFRQIIPLRRPGTPAEVAAMTEFLLSDGAAYSTGGYFMVDGGMLAV